MVQVASRIAEDKSTYTGTILSIFLGFWSIRKRKAEPESLTISVSYPIAILTIPLITSLLTQLWALDILT